MNAKTLVVMMAGVVGLATAAGAFARCPGTPAQCPGVGAAPERTAPPEVMVEGRNQALESVLTLKDSQKAAFKAYADARLAWVKSHVRNNAQDPSKVYDEQTRLESRAAMMRTRADKLADLATKRADLWKVLDPQQKMALEAFESQGNGDRPCFQRQEVRRGSACGCPDGDAPRPERRFQHRPDMPRHY